jgi:hypothetical protein
MENRRGAVFAMSRVPDRVVPSMFLFAVAFIASCVAVQRFSLQWINAWVCILPLSLGLLQWARGCRSAAASMLIVSLLCSIDNGAEVYAETPGFIRYLIYLSAIAMLVSSVRPAFSKLSVLILLLLAISVAIGAASGLLSGATPYQAAAFRRDLFVIFLLLLLVCGARPGFLIDFQIVGASSFGYLAGEVANLLFFYRYEGDYLSYDTLKVFIFFPLVLVMLGHLRRSLLFLITPIVLYIAVIYGSRMILLSAFVLGALIPLAAAWRSGSWGVYAGIFVVVAMGAMLGTSGIFQSEFAERYRVLWSIGVVLDGLSNLTFLEIFELLDRARLGEHLLFLDRPVVELLFGSGLGSGVRDIHGVLSYIPIDAQYAFTVEELASGTFFNLHDFWIDFGLRFGLLPIFAIIYILVIRQISKGFYAAGFWFGLLLFNVTFATSGLLLTAMMVRFWPSQFKVKPET